MKQRRDTFANWAAENPVLLDGELGIVSDDPNLYKVGDGSTAWNALPFRGFDGTLAQELGTSPNAVISQKVVSEKISELSEKIDNLPQGEEFDKQGNYPLLHVGKADDLYGHGESVPAEFSFRATGGKSIKDGVAYIKELQGNAVVWNQQVTQTAKIAEKEGDYYPIFTYATTAQEHTYLIEFDDVNRLANQWLIIGADANGNYKYIAPNMSEGKRKSLIFTMSPEDGNVYVRAISSQNPAELPIENIRFHDLTLMFQAGNEPTTIEEYEARKPIVADEYAYNQGEVIAFNGEAVKSVGDNAWNKDRARNINIDESNGEYYEGGNWLTDEFRCLPNTQYYFLNIACWWYTAAIFFYDTNGEYIGCTGISNGENKYASGYATTPSNCAKMRVKCHPDFKESCMVTLVHSGWKVDTNAGYQPYWEDTLQIDSRIKAEFPNGMHKWDKVYNKDGKGYIVKGTGAAKIKDLSTRRDAEGVFISSSLPFVPKMDNNGYSESLILARFTPNLAAYSYDLSPDNQACLIDGELWMNGQGLSAYTTAQDFVNEYGEDVLYYELEKPTIIELAEPFALDYKVADFGTEELIAAQPSAPFRARTIYQFNAVDQIRENYNEIERIKAALAKAGITLD